MNKSVCLSFVVIPFPSRFHAFTIYKYHWDTFVVGVSFCAPGGKCVLSNDKPSKFLHTNLQFVVRINIDRFDQCHSVSRGNE